jgi:hypothetical protein
MSPSLKHQPMANLSPPGHRPVENTAKMAGHTQVIGLPNQHGTRRLQLTQLRHMSTMVEHGIGVRNVAQMQKGSGSVPTPLPLTVTIMIASENTLLPHRVMAILREATLIPPLHQPSPSQLSANCFSSTTPRLIWLPLPPLRRALLFLITWISTLMIINHDNHLLVIPNSYNKINYIVTVISELTSHP